MSIGLFQVPTSNNQQYTLNSSYSAGGNSLTLNQSVTGIVQAPGVCVVDRIDSSSNKTPTKRTYYKFTGVSGAQLTGLSPVDGTDQAHSVGAIVEFVPDITSFQAVYDTFGVEHSTSTGIHTSLASVVNLQALTITNANYAGISQASFSNVNLLNLIGASQASVALLNVGTMFSASGASLVAIYPSGASGSVLTSVGGFKGVFAPVTSTPVTPNNYTYSAQPANYTTTSTAFVSIDGTNLTKAITTANSDKVRVMFTASISPSANDVAKIQIKRGTTVIALVNVTVSANLWYPVTICLLDNPSTGANTYDVQWNIGTGTTTLSLGGGAYGVNFSLEEVLSG